MYAFIDIQVMIRMARTEGPEPRHHRQHRGLTPRNDMQRIYAVWAISNVSPALCWRVLFVAADDLVYDLVQAIRCVVEVRRIRLFHAVDDSVPEAADALELGHIREVP